MNFIDNLETLLKRQNMTKADLSRALNIPASTISSWTRNSDGISLTTLKKISAYFNISLEELINGSVEVITFSTETFTAEELGIIVDFSKFLIKSRCK
jgi:transcriptional regulator with XRE-family HTH domain|nr:MAG TPA: Helix-turn-helix XRE-family like protein [Caudoviricetes sp.]